ncbi:IclR family transcriptional regulator [Muricoccus radiodurans]|uniref:IclR family transcriptional regulator n=1 Tax=Muricoccus radiodurans TaxID=2231721 RepID=UPI003CF044AC
MRVRRPVPVEPGAATRGSQFVESIARGLSILEAFRAGGAALGNQEIAARTGLPKPTVSRLTHTLTELGYLEYLPRYAKYRLGVAAVSLGQLALSGMTVRQLARPLMQELCERLSCSVSLGRRDRLSMLYVEHCQPGSAVVLQLGLGSRIPLAITAMGRARYAAAPPDERAAIDAEIETRFPARWAAVRDGLQEAVEMHAARGFTLSVGDWQKEVHAAGAAVLLADGSYAAFNCGAPAFMLDRQRAMREAGPRVADLARRVQSLAAGSV